MGLSSGDPKTLSPSKLEDILKPWKPLIVCLDDGLRLKSKETSTVIFTLITLTTFLLWLYQPPILSTISFFGIVGVILEQILPSVTSIIIGSPSKSWTSHKGLRFREICKELSVYQKNSKNFSNWLSTQKLERPVVYIIMISSVLSIISYISYKISNLWLIYFCFIFIVLGRALWFEKENLGLWPESDGKHRDD